MQLKVVSDRLRTPVNTKHKQTAKDSEMLKRASLLPTLLILCAAPLRAEELPESKSPATQLPLVHRDDFEAGMKHWETTDADFWKVLEAERDNKQTKVLRVTGKSNYEPPVRSPHSIAWLKGKYVSDFVLTVKAENTNYKAGGHRDLCLFWGRQDASHFYYVHFGAEADPHSCQVFIVNGKPRTKITVNEAQGTAWGDDRQWHTLRVERTVEDGMIKVFFDDLEKPHMTAKDDTFRWGQVGIGTFDDNGNFDDFELRGVEVKPSERNRRSSGSTP